MTSSEEKMNTAQETNYSYYLKSDLNEYAGEWIVIAEGKIVAHGDEVKQVVEEAKRKFGDKRLLLVKVPGKETMIFGEWY